MKNKIVKTFPRIVTSKAFPNGGISINLPFYFDFFNLRYLWGFPGYLDRDRVLENPTDTMSIVEVLPRAMATALHFMHEQYARTDKVYVNILFDAWYVYHAEKKTKFFMQLRDESPILQLVSEKIKSLYPVFGPSNQKQNKALETSLRTNLGRWSINPYNMIKNLRLNRSYTFWLGLGITSIFATWIALRAYPKTPASLKL